MNILALETSCDETAIALAECSGTLEHPRVKSIAHKIISQIDIHKEYGGVYPTLAKREHARNLVPVLMEVVRESSTYTHEDNETQGGKALPDFDTQSETLRAILEREPTLADDLIRVLPTLYPLLLTLKIDALAVTVGPGLTPALWVGVNFARSLAHILGVPLIPVNHMEGHILSILGSTSDDRMLFPALALLISGGHTELVRIHAWGDYTKIGQTRDDAVGEAFDKVARMLGLPYPGGPEISRLAEEARAHGIQSSLSLPRPMIHSPNYDFSFSGLKTAVLYHVRDNTLDETQKKALARECEDALIDVLLAKTDKAIREFNPATLIVSGGVSANKELRRRFAGLADGMPGLTLMIPPVALATDNAVMIAYAGYIGHLRGTSLSTFDSLKADGNLSL